MMITRRGRVLDASGLSVPPGDSVTICVTLRKKSYGAKVNYWWGTVDGVQEGPKNEDLLPTG